MKQEQAIELKILRELRALQVPQEMLDRQVKSSSGRIDIVIYTQPRCLIEVKAILDERELKKAINQLSRYRASFPRSRLFVAWGLSRMERWAVLTSMKKKGVRRWTSEVARDIAEEARVTPLDVSAPRPRTSLIFPGKEEEAEWQEFFGRASHMSYTTIARLRRVERIVRMLPVSEQEEAKEVLGRLGKHKAAILKPAIQHRPERWREIVEEAEYCSERDLQRQVTRIYGLKSRGPHKRDEGESLYKALLDGLPLDRRGEVHVVFEAASQLARTDSFFNAFLKIVEEAKGGDSRKGRVRRTPLGVSPPYARPGNKLLGQVLH